MKQDGLVIVAGGSGRRYGSNKLLELLNGVPVFLWSMAELGRFFAPDCRVVVVPSSEKDLFQKQAVRYLPGMTFLWADGGERRSDSVLAGLRKLPADKVETAAVHDAARPLASAALLKQVMQAARRTGGAIPGRPVTDTLKRADADNIISETVSREDLFRVETPQCFNLQKLLAAYDLPGSGDFTDDAAVMENAGHPVAIVPHRTENLKLTYREELKYLELFAPDELPKL